MKKPSQKSIDNFFKKVVEEYKKLEKIAFNGVDRSKDKDTFVCLTLRPYYQTDAKTLKFYGLGTKRCEFTEAITLLDKRLYRDDFFVGVSIETYFERRLRTESQESRMAFSIFDLDEEEQSE